MENVKKIKPTDTLRTHFTTIGKVYDVIEYDDECYKIEDDRGRANWIPLRYFEVVE
ncbi:MAG: hypothetical protein WBA54_12485 [Acidaminobacteraceae bacterium]